MFIIYVIFLTTVFANSYEKYIDLLPDEEKQEFLDHVARRVLENVESKEKDTAKTKFSIELTDEQLKEHNDFVESILKQESEQLRRNKGILSKNKDKKADEELKVKPLRDDTVAEKEESSNSSAPEVKLTTKDAETENSTASNEETATQNVTVQKRSIPSDESSEKQVTSAEIPTKFKDLTKNEEIPTMSSVNVDESSVTEATLEQGNNRRSLDTSGSEESETTPNDVSTPETPDEVITTTESIETQISTSTTNSPELKSELDNSTNIGDNEASTVEESEEKPTTQTNSNEKTEENSTNTETEATSVTSMLSSTLPNESTTAAATETTTIVFKAQTDTSVSDLNENITSTTIASLVTNTTDNVAKENVTTTENIETIAVETTTLPLVGSTPAVVEESTKKPTKSKSKLNNTKNEENTSTDVKEEKDNKQKVKEEKEETNLSLLKKDVKEVHCGLLNMSCNHYKVYEVPQNESPFLRSNQPMNDLPSSVPIYNYSPNNAYYNGENRRGPNNDDYSNERQYLREGESPKDITEFQIDFDGLKSKFGKYDKNIDEDKFKEIVNSLKVKDAPLNTETDHIEKYFRLKGGLKTKIRDIRDELFRTSQQHNRLKKDTSNEGVHAINDRDISMDYFYGRSKPNAKFDVISLPAKLDSQTLSSLLNGRDFLKVISIKRPINKRIRLRNKKANKRNKNIKFAVANDRIANERKEEIDYIKHKDEKSAIVAHNNDAKFQSYMNALKELIGQDNNALKQYDWLSTTVQIHAALSKLIELVSRVENSDPVHPADLQILKYITFLYNFATEIRSANQYGRKLSKDLELASTRQRKSRLNTIEKNTQKINRVWLYLRSVMPDLTDQEGLANLKKVLLDVEDGLYDLHDAIKNIAGITKFKNQNWYGNLKELYLSTEEKQLREVLLHISFARLTDLMESSFRNGLEDDFVEYMKKHRDTAKKTLEEVLFVLKITEEINKNSL